MIEHLSKLLLTRRWTMASPEELERRVDAVVTRIDGLEARVVFLEQHMPDGVPKNDKAT